jgi:hypothetical protein
MSLLDNKTKVKVKKLIQHREKGCANFFQYSDVSCEYFEKFVLPNDEKLEDDYKEQMGIGFDYDSVLNSLNVTKYERVCKYCEKSFRTTSRTRQYCSDLCQGKARNLKHKRYNASRKQKSL